MEGGGTKPPGYSGSQTKPPRWQARKRQANPPSLQSKAHQTKPPRAARKVEMRNEATGRPRCRRTNRFALAERRKSRGERGLARLCGAQRPGPGASRCHGAERTHRDLEELDVRNEPTSSRAATTQTWRRTKPFAPGDRLLREVRGVRR